MRISLTAQQRRLIKALYEGQEILYSAGVVYLYPSAERVHLHTFRTLIKRGMIEKTPDTFVYVITEKGKEWSRLEN